MTNNYMCTVLFYKNIVPKIKILAVYEITIQSKWIDGLKWLKDYVI